MFSRFLSNLPAIKLPIEAGIVYKKFYRSFKPKIGSKMIGDECFDADNSYNCEDIETAGTVIIKFPLSHFLMHSIIQCVK